jgi:hypothetical protein
MRNGKVQLPKHLQIFGNYKIYLFVSKNTIWIEFWTIFFLNNPRANGAERLSGRKPGARVLIPPGYLHPGKGTH